MPGDIVANGSFETPAIASGTDSVTYNDTETIGAWTVGGTVDHLGPNWQAADGQQSLDLNGDPGTGSVKQTLTTTAGTRYLIRYAMAGNPPAECSGGGEQRLRVLWDGQEAGRATFDSSARTAAAMGWQRRQILVTAGDTSTEVEFASLEPNDAACGPTVDDISVAPTANSAGSRAWSLEADWRAGTDHENPSRDSYGNLGVWEIQESSELTPGGNGLLPRDPVTYTSASVTWEDELAGMPGLEAWIGSATDPCCGSAPFPHVSKNVTASDVTTGAGIALPPGKIAAHPYGTRLDVMRWESPISGTVRVDARFTDLDGGGGDGADWSVDAVLDGNESNLANGAFANGGDGDVAATVNVDAGDVLLFTLGTGAAGDLLYDSTQVQLTIAEALAVASPPPNPTGLAASAGDARATLDWADTPGATAYEVFRYLQGGAVPSSPTSTTSSSQHVETGLTNGTTYCFRVKATNDSGPSGLSSEACATPRRPVTIAPPQQYIAIPFDTDKDLIPDNRERQPDLRAMGADPRHKDLFLQIDAMPGHELKLLALKAVAEAFRRAPDQGNNDGRPGINLHLDAGPNSIMDPTTGERWDDRSKARKIPHQTVLPAGNVVKNWESTIGKLRKENLTPARTGVFRYGVAGHAYETTGNSSSGVAFDGSFIITLGNSCGGTAPECSGTWRQQAGTLMHEFGHTLGLDHGGPDTFESREINNKPNYLSIMNYSFQFSGLPVAGVKERIAGVKVQKTVFDYSRFGGDPTGSSDHLEPLIEHALSEPLGIHAAGDAARYETLRRSCDPALGWRLQAFNTRLDFDCNGRIATGGSLVEKDVNDDKSVTTLLSHNDWGWIRFNSGGVGKGAGAGIEAPSRLPKELDAPTARLFSRAVFGDAKRPSVRIQVGRVRKGRRRVVVVASDNKLLDSLTVKIGRRLRRVDGRKPRLRLAFSLKARRVVKAFALDEVGNFSKTKRRAVRGRKSK